MVLSFYFAILWILVAAVVLFVRWGRGERSEKIQVATMVLLIIAAYGVVYLAAAILLAP
jgi:hypothetical protein